MILVIILPLNSSYGQTNANFKQTILKTNVLNILLIPSIHIEQQISNKISLQANFHRSKFVLISKVDLLNASIDAKYYFKKKEETRLKGAFISMGVAINHRYNASRFVDSVSISGGITRLGIPQSKLGYQWQSSNHRFIFDTSLGIVALPYSFQKNDYFELAFEYRANIGLGWRL
jgi:hypothetical protein